MADWSKSKFAQQAANPAIPAGLRQQAEQLDRASQSPQGLTPWQTAAAQDYTTIAQSWYGGQNLEGTSNGWNTDFMANMFTQYNEWQDKAAQKDQFGNTSPSTFYDWLNPTKNPTATGVASWEDPSNPGRGDGKGLRKGDVFNNGRWVANVYEDFDEHTANVMMGSWLLEPEQQLRFNESNDPAGAYKEAIDARVQAESEAAAASRTAEAYQRDVAERQQDLLEGLGDEALTAGGAVGGAAIGAGAGAAIGSFFFGVGAAPGALIGGAIGAVAGGLGMTLNRDQATELLARAQEQAELANARYADDWFVRNASIVESYSGVGMRLLSPVSNLVQGTYDVQAGTVGDGTAEFYEFTEDGKRKASLKWQGLDLLATFGDSLLQFASPVGRIGYMTAMTGVAGGKTVETVFGGAGFNERTGMFDDYEGWRENMAALGSAGIDWLQLGMAGAVVRSGQAASRAVGAPVTGLEERLARQVDKLWRAPEGLTGEVQSGVRFLKDSAGHVQFARPTAQFLAPSEFLKMVPTYAQARNLRMLDQGGVGYDDLYKAAVELTSGTSRFRNAFINGYAEAGEEAIQSVLDPVAFSEDINPSDVIESALYGGVSGFGMTYGSMMQAPTGSKRLDDRARTNYQLAHNVDLKDEEWAGLREGMSREQLRSWSVVDRSEVSRIRGIHEAITEMHRIDTGRSGETLGGANMLAMRGSALERALRKVNPKTGDTLVIYGSGSQKIRLPSGDIEDAFPPNSAGLSAFETVHQLIRINQGLDLQASDVKHRLEKAQAEVGRLTGARQAAAQAEVATLQAEQSRMQLLKAESDRMVATFKALYDQLVASPDEATARQTISDMNSMLQAAFRGRWVRPEDGSVPAADVQDLIQQTVELRLTRQPNIDTGSFGIFLPQVSLALTRMNQHATVLLHQGVLKAPNADHDGDTAQTKNDLVLGADERRRFRTGGQYTYRAGEPVLDANGDPIVDMATAQPLLDETGATVLDANGDPVLDPDTALTRTTQKYKLNMDTPDGEPSFLQTFSAAIGRGGQDAAAVTTGLAALRAEFSARYAPVIGQKVVDDAFDEFDAQVAAGAKDARTRLMETLVNAEQAAVLQMDSADGVPEVQWMNWKINNRWEIIDSELMHLAEVAWVEPMKTRFMPPKVRKRQIDQAVRNAERASQDMANLLGPNPARASQKVYYVPWYRAAVESYDAEKNAYIPERVRELVSLYNEVNAEMAMSELDEMADRYAAEDLVLGWLKGMLREANSQGLLTGPDGLLLLAQTQTADVRVLGPNEYEVTDGSITVLQMLLRKALDIQEANFRNAAEDSAVKRRLVKLRELTDRGESHSITAAKALIEVLGNRSMAELVGSEAAAYLGPQLSPQQLVRMLVGKHPTTRRSMLSDWRHAPDYIRRDRKGDPPYSAAEVMSGQLNAFTMIVDAIGTTANSHRANMIDADNRVHAAMIKGLQKFQSMLDDWYQLNRANINLKGVPEEKVRERILTDFLENNARVAESTMASLFPDAAALGAFQIIDDRMYAARWVTDMLLETDHERAAVMYLVNSQIANLNALGAGIDIDDPSNSTNGKLTYDRIKSRFQQTLFILAAQPDKFEMNRMLDAMKNATSVDELFKRINSEPMWLNDREPLLPYHDDVALFEVDTNAGLSTVMTGTARRQGITTWADQMGVADLVQHEAVVNEETNRVLLKQLRNYGEQVQAGTASPHDPMAHLWLMLNKAIQNRKVLPDGNGPIARDMLIEAMQNTGILPLHEKGTAPDRVAALGEMLTMADGFGIASGLSKQLDAMTSRSVQQVLSNPTKLVEGPVRVMQQDGRIIRIDMSDPMQAITMLQDPRTAGLAKAILFPTVRDVDANGNLQVYLDTDQHRAQDGGGSIAELLENEQMNHLFDESLSYKNALRLISLGESAMRKAAESGSEQEKAKAYFPIQTIINDFIEAYTHSPGAGSRDMVQERQELVTEIAWALREISRLSPNDRAALKQAIQATLVERYTGSEIPALQFSDDPERQKLLRTMYKRIHLEPLLKRRKALQAELKQNPPQARLDEIDAELESIVDRIDMINTGKFPGQEFIEWKKLINGFTVPTTGTQAEKDLVKGQILTFLGEANRINRFSDSKNYLLLDKVTRIVNSNMADIDTITDEQWGELTGMVMAIIMEETHGRSSSMKRLLPGILGPEGEAINRYMDPSWFYLAEPLFDDSLVRAMQVLTVPGNNTTGEDVETIAARLEQRLFSPKRLSNWTSDVPIGSMRAREIMKQAVVGMALPAEGNEAKTKFDAVGSGWATFKLPNPPVDANGTPDDIHHTTLRARGRTSESLIQVLSRVEPRALLKLENHFVTKVTIRPAGAPQAMDITDMVATRVHSLSEVAVSPYSVLSLEHLEDRVQKYPGEYELEIQYVDIDKKPFTFEYANNIFFEGMGRETVVGSGAGAIADMLFSQHALSQQGQQNPLDILTKAGSSYIETLTTNFDHVLRIEKSSDRVADVLYRKAVEMLNHKYPDVDGLLPGDINALYKLLLMRHVVVGSDPVTKKRKVVWAEEMIHAQQNGKPEPLDPNWELVALSEDVHQTLRGHGGPKGVRQAALMPVLNPADMDKFPDLSMEKLKRLGLDGLGLEVDPVESQLSTVGAPPRARAAIPYEGDGSTSFDRTFIRLRSDQQHKIHRRAQLNGSGDNNVQFTKINKSGVKKLQRLLKLDNLSPLLQNLGVPGTNTADLGVLQASVALLNKLNRSTDSNNLVIWQHIQDATSDPTRGILSGVDTSNGFKSVVDYGPTLGDVVMVDLMSILRQAGVVGTARGDDAYTKAFALAKEVISAYTRMGATIALNAETDPAFRNMVSTWLRSGSQGYSPLAGSRIFFAPSDGSEGLSKVEEALQSTHTAVRTIDARGLTTRFVSDAFGIATNENSELIDTRQEMVWERYMNVPLPTALTSSQTRYGFNLLTASTGTEDQRRAFKATMLPLLASPEGRAALAKKLGGNPKGVSIYRKTGDYVDPGIRDTIDALGDLHDMLVNDQWHPEPGTELHMGSIIPLVTSSGIPYLGRVGFELPSTREIDEQLKDPVEFNGEQIPVATSKPKLDSNFTMRPPFEVLDSRMTPNGLMVSGRYTMPQGGKGIAFGFKGTYTAWPEHMLPPDVPLGDVNNVRITHGISRKPIQSKATTEGMVNDFQWLFALTGINFKEMILDGIFGQAPRSPQDVNDLWSKVEPSLKRYARTHNSREGWESARLLSSVGSVAEAQAAINDLGKALMPQTFTPIDLVSGVQNGRQTDPLARFMTVFMTVLTTSGVELDHILETQGLLDIADPNDGSQILLMPDVFTDALNSSTYPELRDLLISMANSRLAVDPASGETLYHFDSSFNFHMRSENTVNLDANGAPKKMRVPGKLQVILPIMADENSLGYAHASLKQRSDVSQHVAAVIAGATGGKVAVESPLEAQADIKAMFGDSRITRFTEDRDLYDMLTRIDPGDPANRPWNRITPMEREQIDAVRAKVEAYQQLIDREDKAWTEKGPQADKAANDLLKALGIPQGLWEQDRDEVDFLVRQFLGRPGAAADQSDYVDDIDPTTYISAVKLMLQNVEKGFHPLHGGIVPLEHRAFWEKVFRANEGKANGWAPLVSPNKRKSDRATDWEDWVKVLIGQMGDSNEEFHSMFRDDLDGFWQTYHNRPGLPGMMPLSTDLLKTIKMMDPKTQELILSADPTEMARLSNPTVMANVRKTLDSLSGVIESGDTARAQARQTPGTSLSDQLERQKEWLAGKKLTKQERTSIKNYRQEGANYLDTTRQTTALFRGLTNLSLIMRLANPALWVSGIIEVPMRNAMEHVTNLLTGSSLAAGGKWGADLTELAGKLRVGEMTLKDMGLQSRFTGDEVKALRGLAKKLGNSNEFLGLVYDEMVYKNLVQPGKGKWGNRAEWIAAKIARGTSDPRLGLANTSLAEMYIGGVFEHLMFTDTVMTVEQFVKEMNENPLWLKEQVGDGWNAHSSGMNRVAQVQSRRQTLLSRTIMGKSESLCASDKFYKNLAGHLFKIPFMFTRFNANALLTLTGMNAFDQLLAMHLHGRRTPGSFLRRGLGMKDTDQRHDMADILEGVDLTRPFMRAAVTQTGLMAAGLLAASIGGVSLSGEDEEVRKRRRMATYLNTPYYIDPRRAESDFAYANALFFDSVPYLGTLFKDSSGRSAVVPHWIIRQFTSPMMGITRFFETGDIREVGWGFYDAFSVLPYSAINLFKQADLTAKLLAEAANDKGVSDAPEVQAEVSNTLITLAAVYEKALLENSFVNSIMNASDAYNRNPWLIPKTDETGNIIRQQATGLPVATEALVDYVDAEGNVKQAYAKRDTADALMHQYSENNFTFMVLASLMTGQFNESSYYRGNMVPSQKEVKRPESTVEQGEAFVMRAYADAGGQELLTIDEARRLVKNQYTQAGTWWDADEVEAQAQAIYEANSTKMGAMSILEGDNEYLTVEGGKALFRGMNSKMITPEDAATLGVSMSQELRDQVADSLIDDLMEEGIALGLSPETAYYRMRRLWYGDDTDPTAPGIRELLYSKKIPATGDVTYNQLNVMYAIGPDGKPWATPFKRSTLAQALGIPFFHRTADPGPGLKLDQRGKIVDETLGINTGMSALEQVVEETEITPNDELLKKAENYEPKTNSTFKPFRRYGGGGGYSGSSYGPPFQRMQPLPDGRAFYPDETPFINSNTPYIRRANVRRERITSERGRLKQWQ